MLTARDGILMDRGRGSLQHNCLTGIPIYGPIYIYIYIYICFQWTGKVSLMFQRLFTLTFSTYQRSYDQTMRHLSWSPAIAVISSLYFQMYSLSDFHPPSLRRWCERNDVSLRFKLVRRNFNLPSFCHHVREISDFLFYILSDISNKIKLH